MLIGIDASRAFIPQRTGIEEYSYQVIKHLMNKLKGHQVILYLRKNQAIDFTLPESWRTKVIKWPRFWTQIGLSLEMLFHPVDVLFIPAHTVPWIHPKNTLVTIHGLEYEKYPEAYSPWERFYMRLSIKKSCRWAKKIIAVSENTRKDLMKLYKVPAEKIEVIYEGISTNYLPRRQAGESKHLLFIGRLEKRKNIEGIVEAYRILKEKYKIPHKLVLAGKPGYGYESIMYKVLSIKYKEEIIFTGFITEKEKGELLKKAEVFMFPSFYEGFGLPILEAQSVGVPVVTSNNSSLSEVGGNSVVYCDPTQSESIAEMIYKLISDETFKNDIIQRGYENTRKFSWEKCASEIAKLLRD